MDIARGEYYGLEPAASATWLEMQGGRYDGPEAAPLLARATKMGWLVPAQPEARTTARPRARAPQQPSVLLAARCFVDALATLKLRGFGSAYARATELHARFPAEGRQPQRVAEAVRAFLRAETAIVTPLGVDDCLPRSLALFALLRRCGLAATHRVGIRRYPFTAHAWVEYDRVLLHERPEKVSEFTPIATLGQPH